MARQQVEATFNQQTPAHTPSTGRMPVTPLTIAIRIFPPLGHSTTVSWHIPTSQNRPDRQRNPSWQRSPETEPLAGGLTPNRRFTTK